MDRCCCGSMLVIGAVDRYRPRGRVDSERERERALTEKMRKKNGSQRERERALSDK